MNRLRIAFFAMGLLATLPLAHLSHAAGASAAATHPIIGTWTWVLFDGACIETLRYRVDRTVLTTSAGEVSEKEYDIAVAPDARGFFKLVETVKRQNDKKDCSGALLGGPGEQITRYIQFSPQQDKLLVCREAALTACFGPLKRVP